jgi:glycosyltransferase involved in cell wall biosynthesis
MNSIPTTQPNPAFLAISRYFWRHSMRSGTWPLLQGLPFSIIETDRRYNTPEYLAFRMLWKLPFLRRLAVANVPRFYQLESLVKESRAIRHVLRHRREKGVVQFIWGDHDFLISGKWIHRADWRVSAWFHQTYQQLSEDVHALAARKQLDIALCVSRTQVAYFKQFLPTQRIFFFPLGIDTKFFYPSPEQAYDGNRVIFVGYTLRDFETLRAVCARVAAQKPEVQFDLVALARQGEADNISNSQLRMRLSEEDLREAYQRAALQVQPLHDCSSSIALLEGMACGVPTVITDVGGVRDYATEESAIFCPPKDSESMAAAVLRLLDDRALNARMRASARARALEFAWPLCQKRLAEIYQTAFGVQLPVPNESFDDA